MLTVKLPENDTHYVSMFDGKSTAKRMSNESDANSSSVIGSPLQTSSPLTMGCQPVGDGDSHSIRSVHNMLTPIRFTRAGNRSINNTDANKETRNVQDDEANMTPATVTLDCFLANFEMSSSLNQSSPKPGLQEELILAEKIASLEQNEARQLLTRALIDNMGLRQELHRKEKRILAYKGQMLAILDWKARQVVDSNEENDNHSSQDDKKVVKTSTTKKKVPISKRRKEACCNNNNNNPQVKPGSSEKEKMDETFPGHMTPHKSIRSCQEITVVEEVYGMRRSLSIIQELASSIDVDHELLKDRLKNGYYLTNQLLAGSLAGYTSALFVKKFGKLALSATCGGIILLVYTARKGFVNVNYESIYQELSRICDNVDGTGFDNLNENMNGEPDISLENSNKTCEAELGKSNENLAVGSGSNVNAIKSGEVCAYDKLKQAKNWIMNHTYTVGGFALTFIYNIL